MSKMIPLIMYQENMKEADCEEYFGRVNDFHP